MFSSQGNNSIDEDINAWLKSMPDNKVFKWLGNDSDNAPNYLHLLNPTWDSKRIDSDLQLFQRVAQRLAEEPEYLRQMIRTSFWRHTLIAVVSVILLQAKEYCSDLKFGFNLPNFVSPQIAVALGLICPDEAVVFLSEAIAQAAPKPDVAHFKTDFTIHTDAKRIVAALTVLAKLNPNLAKEAAKFEILQQHQKDMGGEIGASVAEHHWEFWSKVIQNR